MYIIHGSEDITKYRNIMFHCAVSRFICPIIYSNPYQLTISYVVCSFNIDLQPLLSFVL